MFFDGYRQICGSSIVKEKQSLTEPPQRGRPEFIARSLALRYSVRQATAHFVSSEVGIKAYGLVSQRGNH